MSLVNDALKRAKQAQQENPSPTPELAFRPVEPANEGRPNSSLMIIGALMGLVVVAMVGGLLIWAVTSNQGAGLQAEAKVVPPPTPAPAPVEVVTPPPVTNTQPEVVEPPKPEFKLKGIFFNPRSPSAVVNDRTVYLGDKVSGFRVVKITAQAVTLTSATETNVLSLSE